MLYRYHRLKKQEKEFKQKRGQMLKNKAEEELLQEQYVDHTLNDLDTKVS